MDNFNIEEIKADKKELEVKIFDLINDFEEMHRLEIKNIETTIVEPAWIEFQGKEKVFRKRKLMGINLTIEI